MSAQKEITQMKKLKIKNDYPYKTTTKTQLVENHYTLVCLCIKISIWLQLKGLYLDFTLYAWHHHRICAG